MFFEIKITAALLVDQLIGDPRWLPHPVRIIGWFCLWFEGIFRKLFTSKKLAGFCTVVSVLLVTTAAVGMLMGVAASISSALTDCIAVLIVYTTVAAKDLIVHSRKVYACLRPGEDIDAARKAVSMIVGRDTENLDKAGVSRACVETVAENIVDGVTAPLFFGIVCSMLSPVYGFNDIGFAALGAMTYKAINTMDSMFGYKNDKYLEFGWAAARLDDLANFIPARLSGLMVIVSAFILKLDRQGSAKIFFRDRLQHSSPNSAHTEAAVAGALGVQLGGDSFYFGKLTSKPVIGDKTREVCEDDIVRTERIMQIGSLLFTVLLLLLRRFILGI
jgi:adenosylcobinamide-phosphate synthase